MCTEVTLIAICIGNSFISILMMITSINISIKANIIISITILLLYFYRNAEGWLVGSLRVCKALSRGVRSLGCVRLHPKA